MTGVFQPSKPPLNMMQVVNWHCRKNKNVIQVCRVKYLQLPIKDAVYGFLKCR